MTFKIKIAFVLAAMFSTLGAQTDVSRTKLWAKFVADSISGNDGDAVATWTNLQGTAARNFRQTVSAARPTLKKTIINGHAVVRFDGVVDYMDTTGFNVGSNEADLYVVIKADADPAASSTTNGYGYLLASSTVLTQSAHYPHTSGDIYETFRRDHSRINFNPTPALTSFRLYSVHAGTNKYTCRIDTTTVFNSASAYTLDATTGSWKIGKSSNGTSFFDGDIAELRIYIGKLTDAERDTLTSFLDDYYDLPYVPLLVQREADVKGNNVSIADGDATPSATDSTLFGSVSIGSSRSVTYTILNSGIGNLTLSGTPKVAVSGTHSSDFTVTTQPSSPVAASGTTTFVVKFTPSAAGVRSAELSIANDDSNENPYNFSIQGTGSASQTQTVSKRKYFLRRNQ